MMPSAGRSDLPGASAPGAAADRCGAARPPRARLVLRGLAALMLACPLLLCGRAVAQGHTSLAVELAVCFGLLAAAYIGVSAFSTRPPSPVRVEVRAACGLLGFRRPEPARWQSRPLLVWCLVVPVVLALAHVGLDTLLGAVWHPVTDADQAAANARRTELLTRGGAFSLLVLYPFLVAAFPEEIRYRATFLLVQRGVAVLSAPRVVRVFVVAAAAGVSVAGFAFAHAAFGPMNVATSAIGGVFYTGLTLYTRSLWPAILCHGLYDLAVFVPMIS